MTIEIVRGRHWFQGWPLAAGIPASLKGLLDRLTLHKDVRWEMAEYASGQDDGRVETTDLREAEASSSKLPFVFGDMHALLLDIDQSAWLIPSTTPGHHHLYVDIAVPWEKYKTFLRAAADIGLLEQGYVDASIARGCTSLRLPWIRKGEEREAAAHGGTLPPKPRPEPAVVEDEWF